MSPTIRKDESYKQLRNFMKKKLQKEYDNHVFESINIDKIKEINES